MIPAFDPALARRIESSAIVAVLMVDSASDAPPLARALLAGGVRVMELTLRTPVALDALRAVRAEVPEMVAGVGTILDPGQISQVVEAGGAFGVSPGVNRRVLAAARETGLSFAPGIATPTDIEAALEFGCRLLKFFPAEPSGGLDFLRSIAAPYAHLGVKFMPLGGIHLQNMTAYLEDPSICAIGGSWLAPRTLIQERAWDKITALASEAAQATRPFRQVK